MWGILRDMKFRGIGLLSKRSTFLSPAYLEKQRNNRLTAGFGRPQDKGKDYKVVILNFQASRYFILMVGTEFGGTVHAQCHKVQQQQRWPKLLIFWAGFAL